MKNMLSVVGGMSLAAMAGYGAYSLACKNKNKMVKGMKEIKKATSPYTNSVN